MHDPALDYKKKSRCGGEWCNVKQNLSFIMKHNATVCYIGYQWSVWSTSFDTVYLIITYTGIFFTYTYFFLYFFWYSFIVLFSFSIHPYRHTSLYFLFLLLYHMFLCKTSFWVVAEGSKVIAQGENVFINLILFRHKDPAKIKMARWLVIGVHTEMQSHIHCFCINLSG